MLKKCGGEDIQDRPVYLVAKEGGILPKQEPEVSTLSCSLLNRKKNKL